MSDTPNPAPAGAESAPAPTPSFEPMNEAKALEQLLALEGGDDEPQVSEPPAGDEDVTPETADEPEDAPEGDETEETADEEPADDAAEPEQAPSAAEDKAHGNKVLISRDGTKRTVAELWAADEKAREYERVIPQVQAERARVAQAEQALVAREQQFQPVIAQVAAILQQQIPPEASDEMWETDPIAAQMQDRERNKALARLAQVNAAQAEAQQRQAAEAEAQRTRYLQTEQQKLFEAIPILRDPEKAKAFAADFNEIGAAVGFKPEELGQVYDHRLFKLAQYAVKGLRAEQAEAKAKAVTQTKTAVAAKKVVGKPPVAAPTARVGANVRQADVARGAMERLRKNPSNQDAQIAALMALEQ